MILLCCDLIEMIWLKCFDCRFFDVVESHKKNMAFVNFFKIVWWPRQESNLQNILESIALALCAFLVNGAEGRILTYILTFTCQSSIPNVNNSFSEFLESYYWSSSAYLKCFFNKSFLLYVSKMGYLILKQILCLFLNLF